MPQPGLRGRGRAPGTRHFADCGLETDEIALVGIDLGEGELRRIDPGERGHRGRAGHQIHSRIVNPHILEPPGASLGRGARGVDDPFNAATVALIDAQPVDPHGLSGLNHPPGACQIVADQQPDIADHAGVGRHSFIIGVAPRIDRPGRVDDDRFVKDKGEPGDAEAGDDQRCENLVRGDPCGLHRDNLAMLAEPDKSDERAEQYRKGQEARGQQWQAQPDIAPQIGLGIPLHGEDLAGFAKQVERHQHQHERNQHRQAARQEQLDGVQPDLTRREELEVDHAPPAASRPNWGSSDRANLPIRAKPRSSAPIGCPPGLCATT